MSFDELSDIGSLRFSSRTLVRTFHIVIGRIYDIVRLMHMGTVMDLTLEFVAMASNTVCCRPRCFHWAFHCQFNLGLEMDLTGPCRIEQSLIYCQASCTLALVELQNVWGPWRYIRIFQEELRILVTSVWHFLMDSETALPLQSFRSYESAHLFSSPSIGFSG